MDGLRQYSEDEDCRISSDKRRRASKGEARDWRRTSKAVDVDVGLHGNQERRGSRRKVTHFARNAASFVSAKTGSRRSIYAWIMSNAGSNCYPVARAAGRKKFEGQSQNIIFATGLRRFGALFWGISITPPTAAPNLHERHRRTVCLNTLAIVDLVTLPSADSTGYFGKRDKIEQGPRFAKNMAEDTLSVHASSVDLQGTLVPHF
ncbi:hypothetical protein BDV98DRAFT_579184 [Pterulicium gracile]|uniref:Uncharacterized protein n=1 Tax=Pterulicium gracile TaxID=1884261 RepID=A0A5C3QZW3_9AGAR|nr:hypothetical protein BDV98DRAFT_579184 [Pterula gracilis]